MEEGGGGDMHDLAHIGVGVGGQKSESKDDGKRRRKRKVRSLFQVIVTVEVFYLNAITFKYVFFPFGGGASLHLGIKREYIKEEVLFPFLSLFWRQTERSGRRRAPVARRKLRRQDTDRRREREKERERERERETLDAGKYAADLWPNIPVKVEPGKS